MSFHHSPATDGVIRTGYSNGTPTTEIATSLGVSKSVVIGRARRLGLASVVNKAAAARRPSRRAAIAAAKRAWWADPANTERRAFIISRMRDGLSSTPSPNGAGAGS